jgi:Na+-exporting ATPase
MVTKLYAVERSMFSLRPGVPFWKDWVRNRALLWSILVGLGSVVLGESISSTLFIVVLIFSGAAIYVPGVNTQAFHQQAIGWEWGVVFGMTLLFILWCEVWKMMRGRIFKLLRVSTADVYPALNNPVP